MPCWAPNPPSEGIPRRLVKDTVPLRAVTVADRALTSSWAGLRAANLGTAALAGKRLGAAPRLRTPAKANAGTAQRRWRRSTVITPRYALSGGPNRFRTCQCAGRAAFQVERPKHVSTIRPSTGGQGLDGTAATPSKNNWPSSRGGLLTLFGREMAGDRARVVGLTARTYRRLGWCRSPRPEGVRRH